MKTEIATSWNRKQGFRLHHSTRGQRVLQIDVAKEFARRLGKFGTRLTYQEWALPEHTYRLMALVDRSISITLADDCEHRAILQLEDNSAQVVGFHCRCMPKVAVDMLVRGLDLQGIHFSNEICNLIYRFLLEKSV